MDNIIGTRVLSFIGANGGCGTTTMAVTTARAFAECGKQVLYIDCNTDYPNAYRYFKIASKDVKLGISEPLIRMETDVESLVLATDHKRIKLISEKPWALLGSGEEVDHTMYAQMIDDMSTYFDIIIMDCSSNIMSNLTYSAIKQSNYVYTIMPSRPQVLMNVIKKKKFVKEVMSKDKISRVIVNKRIDKTMKENFFSNTGLNVIGTVGYSEVLEEYDIDGKDVIMNGCKGDMDALIIKGICESIVEEVMKN